MVDKLENEVEKDVAIEPRFYRKIIGSKGDNIKEIRDKFNQVQIIIPGQGTFKNFNFTNLFFVSN